MLKLYLVRILIINQNLNLQILVSTQTNSHNLIISYIGYLFDMQYIIKIINKVKLCIFILLFPQHLLPITNNLGPIYFNSYMLYFLTS